VFLVVTLSATVLFVGMHNRGYKATAVACENLTITELMASENDGDLPENTLDNNLSTMRSTNGIGSWFTFDLGSKKTVCHMDIAWYKGDQRINTFVISVSSDGINFTQVYSGKSSGIKTSLERYDFADVAARYVKIIVNGNTQNNWAAITEVDIFGYLSNSSMTDKFGIQMLYPTKTGGQQWYLDMSDPYSDGQFDSGSNRDTKLSRNSDGSWKAVMSNPDTSPPYEMRLHVVTTSGYHPERMTTLEQTELAAKGYMQDPDDWKNVEMTGYIKLNSYASMDQIEWYARGGKHGGASDPDGCEGTSLKGHISFDGRTRLLKEQWHPSGYVSTSSKSTDIGSLQDKWIGYKFVIYNKALSDGKLISKQEIWIDEAANGNWIKYDEKIDSGGWGNEGDYCRGRLDQIITWGGPIAGFRADNVKDIDFKFLSIREIRAP
jgi:F5/8 type C domain